MSDTTRLLVVDDNETNRYLLQRLLTHSGFKVLQCASGNEAIEQCINDPPALVISDLKLGDIDGREVCRRIKAHPRTSRIPVVLISAYFGNRNNFDPIEDAEADGYLAQPVNSVVLISTVQALLRMRSAEDALRDQEHVLREALRARDEFLSIASHELKTPLTAMRLQTQMRQRSVSKGDLSAFSLERLQKMFDSDERQIQRFNRLIDDMLDISRINAGRFTIERELVELRELAEVILVSHSSQLQATGSRIEADLSPTPIRGHWDQQRIEQVMVNLLSNAIKYGEGRPIQLQLRAEDDQAVIRVKDQGRGIAPEDQERIFKRFERAISSTQISGLGLGLYIARQIVEAHGGSISVESRLNEGSTFTVRLPFEGLALA